MNPPKEPFYFNIAALFEQESTCVVIHQWNGDIVYANPAAFDALRIESVDDGRTKSKVGDWNFIDQDNRRLHEDEFPVNKVQRFNSAIRNEIIGIVYKDVEETSWFKVSAYPERSDADRGRGFIVVFFTEITQEILGFSFDDIVDNSEDIIIVTTADDVEAPCGPKIVYTNKAFETVTGYRKEDVLGETPRILQGSLTSKASTNRIHLALKDRKPIRESLLNYKKDGTPYWLDINIFPLRNQFGEVTHFAAIERDVTESKFRADQLERQNNDLRRLKENLQRLVDEKTRLLRDVNRKLERLAYYDALTGVLNRRSLEIQMEQQIARLKREKGRIAIGIIDIDNFKNLNDKYGHDEGDNALKLVSSSMNRFFRQEDVFGRLGGEEFAFSLVVNEHPDVKDIAERLRISVRETGIAVQGQDIHVTVSIGVAIYDHTDSLSLPEMLKQADLLLYEAKENGRDQSVVTDIE